MAVTAGVALATNDSGRAGLFLASGSHATVRRGLFAMSTNDTKQTSNYRPAMSAFGSKADYGGERPSCPLLTQRGHR
jgi:hypothetical protein